MRFATRRTRAGGVRDDGMVTAEIAATLPVIVLVALFSVSLVLSGVDRIRAVDAAGVVARQLARGVDLATATATAERLAPGATVDTSESAGSGGFVQVTVRLPERTGIPLLASGFPAIEAVAIAPMESDAQQ